MTHILIPREPSTALLRPFIGCNTQELHEAWAAMVRIAEVQHARAGSQCLAQIEEPAQPVCWIRFCSDGSTEGPIMHSQICEARKTSGAWTPLYAGAAPAAVSPRGEYPHEQMDAMALDRYKVVPSNASMLWSHAVVAGDGAQQLYVGREVECQNMARKFAGAFLDGAFAFHSMAAAPTAQAAPALEAPAAPAGDEEASFKKWFQGEQGKPYQGMWDFARAAWMARAATAAAPQAPAAPVVDDEGCLSDELRDLITGMTVSVDVSTGEHDAGNRLFGEVTEVMEYDGGSDKHKVVLLVQSPEANFKAAPAAPAVDALSQAARDVLAERQRQIDVEGWTPEHDDEHSDGFMSMAAACYALAQLPGPRPYAFHTLYLWTFTGWSQSWFKVSDRRRNLVKAAALNIAELERLDRAAAQAKEGGA